MTVTTTNLRTPANRRPARRVTAVLAALTTVVAACSASPATDVPTYQTTSNFAEERYATTSEVLAAVAAAQQLQVLPEGAAQHLAAITNEAGGPEQCFDKRAADVAIHNALFGECTYGSRNGTKTMVLFGDSRAPMWAATLERVAAVTGWQLRVFAKGGCPAAELQYQNNETKAHDTDCDTFHSIAVDKINELHPQLVITTSQVGHKLANGELPTTSQWQDAWVSTFQKLTQPGTRVAILGAIPTWDNNDARCLAAHPGDVQACSTETANALSPFFDAERAAASAAGALYVDTVPWVCAEKCEPVISDIVAYYDPYHFTRQYAVYLSGAMVDALKPAMT